MACSREGQAIIGLCITTFISPNFPRLEPQHCITLMPDQAWYVRGNDQQEQQGGETNNMDQLLLMLKYGRSRQEINRFIQSLTNSFPLLIRSHTPYYAKHEKDVLFRAKVRFQNTKDVQTWSIADALTEFGSPKACLAFLMAQDILPTSEGYWTEKAKKKALHRMKKYLK